MHRIVIQHLATDQHFVPSKILLRQWAKKALQNRKKPTEVTIRIVNADEMLALNTQYRQKEKVTNVLSFPLDLPTDIDIDHPSIGDIVICAEVVNREAIEQNKLPNAHWAHMVIHGIFHLLGYDHEKEQEAQIMEALEIKILKSLGFPNPYLIGEN